MCRTFLLCPRLDSLPDGRQGTSTPVIKKSRTTCRTFLLCPRLDSLPDGRQGTSTPVFKKKIPHTVQDFSLVPKTGFPACRQAGNQHTRYKKKSRTVCRTFLGAQDWIRTSTPFPALPPQGSASTNFATWAASGSFLPDRMQK